MTHLKKYWIWYTIAIVVVIAALVAYNWETVKGWFSANGTERQTYDTTRCCRSDNPCGWSRTTFEAQCGSK